MKQTVAHSFSILISKNHSIELAKMWTKTVWQSESETHPLLKRLL